MAKNAPPQNRILRDFLQSGVDTEQPRSSYIAELHEFDDCRYKLERCVAAQKPESLERLICICCCRVAASVGQQQALCLGCCCTESHTCSYLSHAGSPERCRLREAPDVLTVSFACAHPLPDAAEPALRAEYAGTAALAIEPESGYQLTLHVRDHRAVLVLADLHHQLACRKQ